MYHYFFYIAQNDRPGSVLIDFPKDLETKHILNYRPVQPKEILKLQGYRFQYKVNRESIVNTIQLIRKVERPILYVGGGSIIENAYQEIFDLAKFFQFQSLLL